MGLGMSRDQVQDRSAGGQLHRIHRGVYAVGHRKLTLKGVWMSAVLACAPGARITQQRLQNEPEAVLEDLRRPLSAGRAAWAAAGR